MHRDSQLDGTERGTGVPAHARACINDELPDLIGDFLQVIDPELSEIGRRIYFGKKSHNVQRAVGPLSHRYKAEILPTHRLKC
jgi:hypothetical protein